MKKLMKRHLRIDGNYFNQCIEHENIDMWMGKSPFTKFYKDSDKEFGFYACHTPIPGYFYQDEHASFLFHPIPYED